MGPDRQPWSDVDSSVCLGSFLSFRLFIRSLFYWVPPPIHVNFQEIRFVASPEVEYLVTTTWFKLLNPTVLTPQVINRI